jgi:dihydrofolate reductase
MAVDDEGGVSKMGSMPWPRNSNDLKWFKKYTLNNVVIMGRLTWIDPHMPNPLINRINVLITNQDKTKYPGADEYISGDLISKIKSINIKYSNLHQFIIGGPKILDQLFELVEELYLTRIYGKFDCDKKIDLRKIEDSMTLEKKIVKDKTCHFEIWKR